MVLCRQPLAPPRECVVIGTGKDWLTAGWGARGAGSESEEASSSLE